MTHYFRTLLIVLFLVSSTSAWAICVPPVVNDSDGDCKTDAEDNCWDVPNPDQKDLDGDEAGDVCDIDRDGDGYTNTHEPLVGTNPDNWDTDGDHVRDPQDCAPRDATKAIGSDCDITAIGNVAPSPISPDISDPSGDDDEDGFPNGTDNCPSLYNPGQQDVDEDGLGDACDNVVDSNTQVYFIKGGGGPGANCTLFTGAAANAAFPLTSFLILPVLVLAVFRKKN